MKIDSIYHPKDSRRKECKGDRQEKRFSKDPVHHPMLLEREYVRALNSAKIERMLAKPFVMALTHHREGINRLSKDYESNLFVSSSYDNKVVLWDLTTKNVVKERYFDSIVNGIGIEEDRLYVTQNKTVIINNTINIDNISNINNGISDTVLEIPSIVTSIDLNNNLAVGHNDGISIFDIGRLTPKTTFSVENVTSVKYNRSFKYVLAALSGLTINMMDIRSGKEFLNIDNTFNNNCISFNPQEGNRFVVGGEDGNGYLYDMRNVERPLEIYRGHTNAIVAASFDPTGREVATGSFDRTIRIFKSDERKSRDCYYNDRMHIVYGVEYSNDGDYIVSGSDDGSLRIWKSEASKKAVMSKAEKETLEYNKALRDKFKNVGEISRITKHRFLNKEIKNEMRVKHEMYEGKLRREAKRKQKEEQEQEEED